MIFGYELIIDGDCGIKLSRDLLRKYIIDLCKLIKMKRWGKPQIVYFGKDRFKGFSLLQFITTSSITGHFTETEIHINVFSCKEYNPCDVVSFTKDFFKTQNIKAHFIER